MQEHSTPRSEYPNSHKMLAHTNVWEIGATMFELLTLERVNYYYKELGNYGKLDAAALIKRYPYQVLMTTILRCLEPEPVDRITIEGLQIIIRQEQESFVDPFAVQPKENSTNPDENDRLYYRGNEIENMPPGDWIANHSTPEDTKDSDDVYRDPSLSPLRYPVFEDESDGSDDNGESDGLDDEDEDLSTKTRLWNKYNKRPADDDRMFTEWKTSFVRKHQKGQEANPITLLSSKAASAGADPAGNDGVDGYRDVSNHAGSDGNPPSAPPARRLGSKRLLNNAAAQGSGALPNPFRPVWPIPGSSAARGGANASLEEGEFGEENGEDELQLPQLAPQGYSGLLRQAQAALGSVASSLGLTRRSEREQGDGGHGGGQAGAEDEDDGPHGPSSSSQMPTDEGEEGERMSVSSGPSPTFYQHGTHGGTCRAESGQSLQGLLTSVIDGTQSGSSSSQDENQPQAGSRAASAPNILPQQGDQAQQTDRRASSAHTTGSEVGVIRRDMYYAPQNPQPPYRQDVALLGMTGEMFNRSPTEMRPPREGEIVLDALVTSHRDAERSGDVATTQNLDRAYGRFFSFYQAAEDAGIGNVLGGLGEVFGMGRRVGWRDRR